MMNYKNYFIPFCSYILKGGCPIIAIAPHWCLKCTVLNTGKAELNARHFSPPNAWRALGDHCWWFVHLAEKSNLCKIGWRGRRIRFQIALLLFFPSLTLAKGQSEYQQKAKVTLIPHLSPHFSCHLESLFQQAKEPSLFLKGSLCV